MKLLTLLAAVALLGIPQSPLLADPAATPADKEVADISYKAGDNLTDYEKERCKLDLYLPTTAEKGFPTIVWFHGGGLTGGNKHGEAPIAHSLTKAGVAVVCAGYRFSPKVKYPAYIEDAAAAFAWTYAHIAEYGGDPAKVFVGGHSAGGYLTFMVGLDERYLQKLGVPISAVAGMIPVSGQTMTHYTVREERGLGKFTVTADEAAPVYYCRKDTPPMLVLYAEHDMTARVEENAYLIAMLKGAGNKRVKGQLILDRDHGGIDRHIADDDDPARAAILEFIQGKK